MVLDIASIVSLASHSLSGMLLSGLTVVLYVYAIYSIPIVLNGFRSLLMTKERALPRLADYPFISIVVPARNEEKVIGSTLENILSLEYPANKWEAIVVEDHSVDKTREVIERYAAAHSNIRYLHCGESGKPRALNLASEAARGDVLLFIDADSKLRQDALKTGAAYMSDTGLSALIGYPSPLNYNESLLTKASIYEIIMWDLMIKGKQSWNLFLPLTGFGMFIRKDVLIEVGKWDVNALAEDTELAVRMVLNGHRVIQAPIYNWQEFPSTARALIKQRVRWYRGGIEAFLKHRESIWTRMKVLLAADVVLTLLGSIPGALILVAYAATLALLPQMVASNATLPFLAGMIAYQALYLSLLIGVVRVRYPKGSRMDLVRRIPISYYYSILLSIASMKAIFDVIFRRPGVWVRSVKSGRIDPFIPFIQTSQTRLVSAGISAPFSEKHGTFLDIEGR